MSNPFDNDCPDNLPRHILQDLNNRLIDDEDAEVEELDFDDDEPRRRRLTVNDAVIYGED